MLRERLTLFDNGRRGRCAARTINPLKSLSGNIESGDVFDKIFSLSALIIRDVRLSSSLQVKLHQYGLPKMALELFQASYNKLERDAHLAAWANEMVRTAAIAWIFWKNEFRNIRFIKPRSDCTDSNSGLNLFWSKAKQSKFTRSSARSMIPTLTATRWRFTFPLSAV